MTTVMLYSHDWATDLDEFSSVLMYIPINWV